MSTSKQIWVPVYRRDFGAHRVPTEIYLRYIAMGWRVVGLFFNHETERLEAEMERAAGPALSRHEGDK